MTREELFNKWKQLGLQIQMLGGIVQNPMDTVSRDDILDFHTLSSDRMQDFQELVRKTVEFIHEAKREL